MRLWGKLLFFLCVGVSGVFAQQREKVPASCLGDEKTSAPLYCAERRLGTHLVRITSSFPWEPASMGSLLVQLYHCPGETSVSCFDDFEEGRIEPREGEITSVLAFRHGTTHFLAIGMNSSGTGSYETVYLFRLQNDKKPFLHRLSMTLPPMVTWHVRGCSYSLRRGGSLSLKKGQLSLTRSLWDHSWRSVLGEVVYRYVFPPRHTKKGRWKAGGWSKGVARLKPQGARTC